MFTDQPHNPPANLVALENATQSAGFGMASDRLTGAFLRTLAAGKPGGRLLELGTGTGLATAWLLAGMSEDATLATVDNDGTMQAIARSYLGHDRRCTFHTLDGEHYLQMVQTKAVRFDLIFADTWPGKFYLLEETLALLAPGGYYVIDDLLPQPNWPDGHGHKVDALIGRLETHPHLTLVKLGWSTGLILAVNGWGGGSTL